MRKAVDNVGFWAGEAKLVRAGERRCFQAEKRACKDGGDFLKTLVRTQVAIGLGRRLGIVHGLLLDEESAHWRTKPTTTSALHLARRLAETYSLYWIYNRWKLEMTHGVRWEGGC